MSRAAVQYRRRGTTTVEFAITCPIVFFLVFATIIGGLGVFRYQQVAALAARAPAGPAYTAPIMKTKPTTPQPRPPTFSPMRSCQRV